MSGTCDHGFSGGRAPMAPGALSVLVSHIVPAAQQMLSLSAPLDQSQRSRQSYRPIAERGQY